jgi:hypothetical protein
MQISCNIFSQNSHALVVFEIREEKNGSVSNFPFNSWP